MRFRHQTSVARFAKETVLRDPYLVAPQTCASLLSSPSSRSSPWRSPRRYRLQVIRSLLRILPSHTDVPPNTEHEATIAKRDFKHAFVKYMCFGDKSCINAIIVERRNDQQIEREHSPAKREEGQVSYDEEPERRHGMEKRGFKHVWHVVFCAGQKECIRQMDDSSRMEAEIKQERKQKEHRHHRHPKREEEEEALALEKRGDKYRHGFAKFI